MRKIKSKETTGRNFHCRSIVWSCITPTKLKKCMASLYATGTGMIVTDVIWDQLLRLNRFPSFRARVIWPRPALWITGCCIQNFSMVISLITYLSCPNRSNVSLHSCNNWRFRVETYAAPLLLVADPEILPQRSFKEILPQRREILSTWTLKKVQKEVMPRKKLDDYVFCTCKGCNLFTT